MEASENIGRSNWLKKAKDQLAIRKPSTYTKKSPTAQSKQHNREQVLRRITR